MQRSRLKSSKIERAEQLGLNPPEEIKRIIQANPKENESLFEGRIWEGFEMISSIAYPCRYETFKPINWFPKTFFHVLWLPSLHSNLSIEMSGHGHTHQHHHKNKTLAGQPEVARAEANMMAGKNYENPHQGHNEMFDTFDELKEHRREAYGNHSSRETRGVRIDRELEQEDQQRLQEKEAARAAKRNV